MIVQKNVLRTRTARIVSLNAIVLMVVIAHILMEFVNVFLAGWERYVMNHVKLRCGVHNVHKNVNVRTKANVEIMMEFVSVIQVLWDNVVMRHVLKDFMERIVLKNASVIKS